MRLWWHIAFGAQVLLTPVFTKNLQWHLHSVWPYAKKARRERARGEKKKGPSYYTLRKHRLGNALVNLVDRTLRANELTYTKAAKILSVKPSNVESLLGGVKTLSGSLSSKKE